MINIQYGGDVEFNTEYWNYFSADCIFDIFSVFIKENGTVDYACWQLGTNVLRKIFFMRDSNGDYLFRPSDMTTSTEDIRLMGLPIIVDKENNKLIRLTENHNYNFPKCKMCQGRTNNSDTCPYCGTRQ